MVLLWYFFVYVTLGKSLQISGFGILDLVKQCPWSWWRDDQAYAWKKKSESRNMDKSQLIKSSSKWKGQKENQGNSVMRFFSLSIWKLASQHIYSRWLRSICLGFALRPYKHGDITDFHATSNLAVFPACIFFQFVTQDIQPVIFHSSSSWSILTKL